MKKLFLIATAVLSLTIAQAQQDQRTLPKLKEFGIGLPGLNSFSLQYRWGNEKRLFRLTGNIGGSTSSGNDNNNSTTVQDTLITTSIQTDNPKTPINLNFGLGFSILKINPVTEKFGFVYGGITALNYFIYQSNNITTQTISDNSSNDYTITTDYNSNSNTFQPSIGIILGAVYRINSSFLIYAEVAPNIYYAYRKTKSNSNISTTLTNSTTTNHQSSSTNFFGVSNLSNSGAMLTFVYRWSN